MNDASPRDPWRPKPFSVAVLDSDETLADALCDILRNSGFDATAFHDVASLSQAHRTSSFDAYVLDFLADWRPESNALETLVTSIRQGHTQDAPIFILGNQAAPERAGRLGDILMQHRVRYQLRPVRASYLAQQVMEAVAKRAGL